MITPQEFFTLLSDETRLRCLILLQKESELCVCELSCVLESIQPKISRHLAHLRKSGLVLDERRGQWVYYRLGKLETWMHMVLKATFEEVQNIEPHRSDLLKLKELRHKNCCS